MEYVEGENLGDLLERKGSLSTKDALLIAWKIVQALKYAHSMDITHRDIKP